MIIVLVTFVTVKGHRKKPWQQGKTANGEVEKGREAKMIRIRMDACRQFSE